MTDELVKHSQWYVNFSKYQNRKKIEKIRSFFKGAFRKRKAESDAVFEVIQELAASLFLFKVARFFCGSQNRPKAWATCMDDITLPLEMQRQLICSCVDTLDMLIYIFAPSIESYRARSSFFWSYSRQMRIKEPSQEPTMLRKSLLRYRQGSTRHSHRQDAAGLVAFVRIHDPSEVAKMTARQNKYARARDMMAAPIPGSYSHSFCIVAFQGKYRLLQSFAGVFSLLEWLNRRDHEFSGEMEWADILRVCDVFEDIAGTRSWTTDTTIQYRRLTGYNLNIREGSEMGCESSNWIPMIALKVKKFALSDMRDRFEELKTVVEELQVLQENPAVGAVEL